MGSDTDIGRAERARGVPPARLGVKLSTPLVVDVLPCLHPHLPHIQSPSRTPLPHHPCAQTPAENFHSGTDHLQGLLYALGGETPALSRCTSHSPTWITGNSTTPQQTHQNRPKSPESWSQPLATIRPQDCPIPITPSRAMSFAIQRHLRVLK